MAEQRQAAFQRLIEGCDHASQFRRGRREAAALWVSDSAKADGRRGRPERLRCRRVVKTPARWSASGDRRPSGTSRRSRSTAAAPLSSSARARPSASRRSRTAPGCARRARFLLRSTAKKSLATSSRGRSSIGCTPRSHVTATDSSPRGGRW